MKYINSENVVIKSWCETPEEGALEQAKNLANLPFIFKHVALMPDTHQGYGMPIGGVIATQGVVIPNAVGVDIGCGMCAIKLNIKTTDLKENQLKNIITEIRKVVPVGFNHQKESVGAKFMPKIDGWDGNSWAVDKAKITKSFFPIVTKEYQSARKQLGTLGSGNHFIEIQKDEEGFIWIMIHSGSRNLGKQVADYHNKIAKGLNELWFSSVPKEWDLAFLPIETEEAKCYMREMQYCLKFAYANRKLMMERVVECIAKEINYMTCSLKDMINIHHNYAAWENHFGKNIIVHRKGATSAREGEIGLIPSSQGAASYVVKGRGNPESFMSCSHGAGRKMGRKAAQKNLDLETEQKILNDKGIIHSIRGKSDLDEASSAYKDIDIVMAEQKDLVDILYKLEPLAVIKG